MRASWWKEPPILGTLAGVMVCLFTLLVPLDLKLLGSEWRMFPRPDFSFLTEQAFLWALPITLMVNGLLSDILLSQRSGVRRVTERLLSGLKASIPLLGVVTVMRAAALQGRGKDHRSSLPREEISRTQVRHPAMLLVRVPRFRLDISLLWVLWMLAWNFLLLLAFVEWITAPDQPTSSRTVVITVCSVLLHGASFWVRWHTYATKAAEQGMPTHRARGYRWLGISAALPEPAGMLVFAATVYYERKHRGESLARKAFSSRQRSSSLPSLHSVAEAFLVQSKKRPWWQRTVQSDWRQLKAVGQLEKRFLAICRVKTWWIGLDAALLGWCWVWLRQRNPHLSMPCALAFMAFLLVSVAAWLLVNLSATVVVARSPFSGLGRLLNDSRPGWQMVAWEAFALSSTGIVLGALATLVYLPYSLAFTVVLWLPPMGSVFCLRILTRELKVSEKARTSPIAVPPATALPVLAFAATLALPLGGLLVPLWVALNTRFWRRALGRDDS